MKSVAGWILLLNIFCVSFVWATDDKLYNRVRLEKTIQELVSTYRSLLKNQEPHSLNHSNLIAEFELFLRKASAAIEPMRVEFYDESSPEAPLPEKWASTATKRIKDISKIYSEKLKKIQELRSSGTPSDPLVLKSVQKESVEAFRLLIEIYLIAGKNSGSYNTQKIFGSMIVLMALVLAALPAESFVLYKTVSRDLGFIVRCLVVGSGAVNLVMNMTSQSDHPGFFIPQFIRNFNRAQAAQNLVHYFEIQTSGALNNLSLENQIAELAERSDLKISEIFKSMMSCSEIIASISPSKP